MKISWQAIVDAIAAIYKAFFKGKTVGGVVLPSKGQGATPPGTGLDLPHKFEPPDLAGKMK